MESEQQFARYGIIQRHAGRIETGIHSGIIYEIYDPSTPNSMVKIHLKQGQMMKAAYGSMLAASNSIKIEGKLKPTFKALIEAENKFSQTMTAVGSDGWVILAPKYLGSIMAVPINGQELFIGDGGFLAAIGDITSTASLQSLAQAMFSSSAEGFWVKKVSGRGVVFVCAIGCMTRFDLDKGQKMIVRNGHLVIWPKNMPNRIRMASRNWIRSAMSGQGLVSELTGPGIIYVQTRNSAAFAAWVSSNGPSDDNGQDADDAGDS